MAGFRDRFIFRMGAFAGKLPTSLLLNFGATKTILTFYHAISDTDLPHIKHLYEVKNVSQFETDLDFLLKHFDAIDYHEFVNQIPNKMIAKKPTFLLSFDDGLREFHDVIAPILLRKGIPAICFLNSAFVDNKALFYRYKVSLLIVKIEQNPSKLKQIGGVLNGKLPWKNQLLNVNYQNQALLEEIADRIDIDFQDFLKTEQPYLTSSQIQSLIKQGFAFGGHSVDHPPYNSISLKAQIAQTRESVEYVSNSFDLSYKTFSFPFTDYGVSKSFFDLVQKENIADVTFGSAGLKKDQAVHNHQRIALEMAQLSAQQIIHSELLYRLVRSPFGKNLIRRRNAV